MRHGAGDSTADSVLPQAAVLARRGYGVLATDARGHARSEGRAMDFGWFGDEDIEAAVSFLADQPGVEPDRIGVVGFSMGGEEAIGAATADPRIAAVVAEGATARTDGDKTWLADQYGLQGRFQLGLEWIQYTVTDLLTDASKPSTLPDAVEDAAPTPVLLIAAGEVEDEQQAAAHLKEKSPSTVTVWVVPDAGHTDGFDTAPDEWEERVVGFLDAALQRSEMSGGGTPRCPSTPAECGDGASLRSVTTFPGTSGRRPPRRPARLSRHRPLARRTASPRTAAAAVRGPMRRSVLASSRSAASQISVIAPPVRRTA
jgi:dienelactone hydrolase